MAPILGIWASQVTGKLSTPDGFESIATGVGTGSNNAITFTSIPQTYKHLQIRMFGRLTGSSGLNNNAVRFNNDSGNNYAIHFLQGDGSSATAGNAAPSVSLIYGGGIPGDAALSNCYGVSVIDILDYSSTSKFKTVRVLAGQDYNGSGLAQMQSGLWMSTSAITTISNLAAGNSWASGTQIALYGIKGD